MDSSETLSASALSGSIDSTFANAVYACSLFYFALIAHSMYAYLVLKGFTVEANDPLGSNTSTLAVFSVHCNR